MPITESSGREPWIFRVDDPTDLIGAHRKLIAGALEPREPILHLIYSPAWEGSTAPFGISGHPASHAIAVTPSRWIISEDRHETWSAPRVHSIPFSHILTLEKGSALLQAWLVIRYAEAGALQHVDVLHKAVGAHHFDEAVRMYRSIASTYRHAPHDGGESDSWQHVPRYIAQELMPVLVDGEVVSVSSRTTEEWRTVRSRWKRVEKCVQPWSAFLITDLGFIYAEAETSQTRGLTTFGTNVWTIPREALRTAHLAEDSPPRLQLALTRDEVRLDVSAAVPSADDAVVRALHTEGTVAQFQTRHA